jgi:hypothetical protein
MRRRARARAVLWEVPLIADVETGTPLVWVSPTDRIPVLVVCPGLPLPCSVSEDTVTTSKTILAKDSMLVQQCGLF